MSTAQAVLTKLAAYDIKPVGPNKYRSRSPLRAGADGKTNFSLVIYDEEHGGYYDWGDNSHFKGSLYDLAKHLGIELPSASTASTKRRFIDMADYAHAHGVEASVFAEAGWSLVTYQQRPALAILTETGTRHRFLDGDKPAFKSPGGYKKCWYGLRRADTLQRLATGQPLILANGEASVVVAHHYGLAVACVTAGEMDYPPHLVEQLKTHLGSIKTPILIAFDCDLAGRTAARQVEETLRAHGFNAHAVNLDMGDEGQDLADFCRLFGEDSPTAISHLPRLTVADTHVIARRNWQIVPRAFLRSLPPVQWLIPGDIQQNAINVIFGPSGAGKSFLAIHYAALLAQGGHVVYMAGEGEYGLDGRLTAWEKHHQVTTDNGMSICLGAVEIIQEGDLDSFIDEIRALQPTLVIVDTLARAMMTGDENDARDMKQFIRACEAIRDQLQTTIILVHHTNKEGIFERGSGVLRASVDIMLKVTAEDDRIKVEKSKSKEASAAQPTYYTLLPIEVTEANKLYKSAVLLPADKIIQTTTDRLTPTQFQILELMAADTTTGIERRDIAAAFNLSISTATRALATLKKLGYITQSEAYKPFNITLEGVEKVKESGGSGGSRDFKKDEASSLPIVVDPPDPPDSLDTLEIYAIQELGAVIEDMPRQVAFIGPLVKYD